MKTIAWKNREILLFQYQVHKMHYYAS